MNEKNLETHQNFVANDKNVVFITRRKARFSTASFLSTSIMLALLIASAVSFTPQFSGSFIVGGVLALIMGLVVIQQPELGAYLLMMTVFTNLSDLITERGLPSVNQPLIAITYLSILANYVIRRGNAAILPRISRVEFFLLFYYLVITASLLTAQDNNLAFKSLLDVSKDILSGVCIYLAFNSKQKWRTGAWILIIVIANLSLLSVIKMVSGTSHTFGGLAQLSALGQQGADGSLRYAGPIGESNIWAQVSVAALVLTIYRFMITKNTFVKVNLFFAVILIALAIIFTGSRGAIVALAIVLPMIIIERKISLPTVLTVVIVVGSLFLMLPSSYAQRFGSLGILFDTKNEYNLEQDGSLVGRRNAMLVGLEMFKANPFLGVGFGNYGISYWKYASPLGISTSAGSADPTDLPQAHSVYIEVISETGLLGMLTFGAFFSSLLLGLLRARKKNIQANLDPDWTNWLTAFFFSILSFLISGIFLHGILWRFIWMLIGLAMAALAISENRSKSGEEPLTQPRHL